MNRRFSNITGVVLVGGKSRRMGQDKALLPVDGQPVIERVLAALQGCFEKIILVGDRPERFAQYQLPIVADLYPGSSLGGLYTGLQQAGTDRIFVASCDMPFPNPGLIRLICRQAGQYDAIMPTTAKGLEPLFACYRASCLPAMRAALEAGTYRITGILEQLQVKELGPELLAQVDPGGRALLNINTPQEYAVCQGLTS